ncbi:MAG: thioredoxin family protein [Muribaculaceae bacterium]|nr:thioredoxin family protein [Muribaculaceae bacterium]
MNDYTALINSSPLVMVEFYATWCGHCQRMMPVIAQIRELVGDNAKIYQLDIDENSETAEQVGVTGTPTFIIYRDGQPVWQFSGELDGNVLLQKLQSFMG